MSEKFTFNQVKGDEKKREPINSERINNQGYKNIPITGRTSDKYVGLFNLGKYEKSRTFFKDKTVLDLGAGDGGLVDHLTRHNITDKAFAVDFLYGALMGETKFVSDSKCSPPNDHKICARVEDLPISDNTVDFVVALKSFPLHVDKKEDLVDFFREIVRVLKPGGEARISPVKNLKQWMGRLPKNLVEKLFPKTILPEPMSNWETEMKHLGISSLHDYKVYLNNKYNNAEKWTQECIKELRNNSQLEIEIVSVDNFYAVSGLKKEKDVLVIRKKKDVI